MKYAIKKKVGAGAGAPRRRVTLYNLLNYLAATSVGIAAARPEKNRIDHAVPRQEVDFKIRFFFYTAD